MGSAQLTFLRDGMHYTHDIMWMKIDIDVLEPTLEKMGHSNIEKYF